MYTFNHFVFGHDLSVNKELNNSLWGFGVDYETTINNKRFEVTCPYHGGKSKGDTFSVILGCIITDNDHNPNYIEEVRNSKEEDYINEYNIFLEELIKDLNDNKGIEEDGEYDQFADELITFLRKNIPKFYIVEASS